jgi:hypothetical protein
LVALLVVPVLVLVLVPLPVQPIAAVAVLSGMPLLRTLSPMTVLLLVSGPMPLLLLLMLLWLVLIFVVGSSTVLLMKT